MNQLLRGDLMIFLVCPVMTIRDEWLSLCLCLSLSACLSVSPSFYLSRSVSVSLSLSS